MGGTPAPIAARLVERLMEARALARRLALADGRVSEDESRLLNELRAATRDAQDADDARIRGIYMLSHGELSDWHRRKQRERAARNDETASAAG